jgi:putative ABC transport system permease protein
VLIPIQKARQLYSRANQSYSLAVIAPSSQEKESAIGYSTALMRAVRKQHPKEAEDSFVIQQSDNISQILISQLSGVIIASTIIGAITLFGASIGLMNIMLVSVTDRTREIGIRKAIGAKSSTIMKQFLIEAIIICQFGGLVGVILGIGIGNVLALSMGGNFMVPWGWVVLGFTISFAVGAVAGFYPAMKASRLDPIESLRHE